MATTSFSLGPYWEKFIKDQVDSGRYKSASEVIRNSLRMMETREEKLQALRKELAESAAQLDAGLGIRGVTVEDIMAEVLKHKS